MNRRLILHHLAVYGLYLLIVVLITWPLARDAGSALAGFPYGDGQEMARHIWWYNHALRTGGPIFWQPLLGYPEGMEGVLLWAHPQQFFPAWLLAFALPLPAAANLTILLYLALNGWAMYLVMRRLLAGHAGAALLAGLIYAAAPTFQAHLGAGHAGLLVGWGPPLYLYALLRLDQRPALKWGALAVVCFVLSAGGHILQAIYVLLPITAAVALPQLARRGWPALARTVAAAGIGAVALGVYLLPVAAATFSTPAYTDEGGFVRYSADLLSVVTPSFFHPLFGQLDYPRRVLGVNLDEGTSYIGLAAGALALIAAARERRARVWLLLALIAWVFSLGPLLKLFDAPVRVGVDGYAGYIALPWAALQNLPVFSLARTPARFNFALALAVAGLAGYGAAWIGGWLVRRRIGRAGRVALLIGAAAFVLFEYQVFWPLPTTPAHIPDAIHTLNDRADLRAVLNLPWANPVAAKEALYLQTAHGHALIAGHVTRSTPVSPARLDLLARTLDPALLDAAGADVVLIHRAHASEAEQAFARAQLGDPLYEDARFALYDVPAAPAIDAPLTWIDPAERIERQLNAAVYSPAAGMIDFAGTLAGAEGRRVVLRLDGQPVHAWTIEGEHAFSVPLALEAGAFHQVTLALDPPCPQRYDPAQRCDDVGVHDLRFESFAPLGGESVTFAHGAALTGFAAPAIAGDSLVVRLNWAFSVPVSADIIRFIHVLDETGALVDQIDESLGEWAAGSAYAERLTLPLPGPGTYRVIAGWYAFAPPDYPRYRLADGRDFIELGTIEVRS